MMLLPVCVHKIKSDIMSLVISGKIDFKVDTLRTIGEKIGLRTDVPQQVKWHLEALVNMGTLEKKNGHYFFNTKKYLTSLDTRK